MNVFLKRILNDFVFGNFLISFCAAGMVLSTFLMNGLSMRITPFTVFLTFSTYIIYNFHRVSYKLNYTGLNELLQSARNITISKTDLFIYSFAVIILIVSVFFIQPAVYPYLIPLILLTLSYSIPFISIQRKKVRLPEIFFIKTPVLALVWGISTTVIPLVEQNVSLSAKFIWLQIISRSFFIFALCIPFEIRDIESDRKNNVKTLPVVYGIKATKITGLIIIIIEIITHHLMQVNSQSLIIALDVSSLFALYWIIRQNKTAGKYFYKLLVDGTMLVRFLFIFVSLHFF